MLSNFLKLVWLVYWLDCCDVVLSFGQNGTDWFFFTVLLTRFSHIIARPEQTGGIAGHRPAYLVGTCLVELTILSMEVHKIRKWNSPQVRMGASTHRISIVKLYGQMHSTLQGHLHKVNWSSTLVPPPHLASSLPTILCPMWYHVQYKVNVRHGQFVIVFVWAGRCTIGVFCGIIVWIMLIF